MTNPLQCRLRQWNLAACLLATSYRPLETKVNVKWVLSIVGNRTCLISCQFIDVTEFVRVACLLLSLLESTGASLTVLTLNSSRMARELHGYGLLWVFFVDSQNPAWIYISTFSQRAGHSRGCVFQKPSFQSEARKQTVFPTTSRSEFTCVLKQRICIDGKARS